MKTLNASQEDIQDKWYIVDVSGARIGHAASIVSQLLLGKNDPKVKQNHDPRAFVIVVNADKIDFTPKRAFTKFYKSYSGYPSGQTFKSLEEKFEESKVFPFEKAVKGMLPKNSRGRMIVPRLKVFEGEEHAHESQSPIKIDINKYNI